MLISGPQLIDTHHNSSSLHAASQFCSVFSVWARIKAGNYGIYGTGYLYGSDIIGLMDI